MVVKGAWGWKKKERREAGPDGQIENTPATLTRGRSGLFKYR
jgi:hypothetical protein